MFARPSSDICIYCGVVFLISRLQWTHKDFVLRIFSERSSASDAVFQTIKVNQCMINMCETWINGDIIRSEIKSREKKHSKVLCIKLDFIFWKQNRQIKIRNSIITCLIASFTKDFINNLNLMRITFIFITTNNHQLRTLTNQRLLKKKKIVYS